MFSGARVWGQALSRGLPGRSVQACRCEAIEHHKGRGSTHSLIWRTFRFYLQVFFPCVVDLYISPCLRGSAAGIEGLCTVVVKPSTALGCCYLFFFTIKSKSVIAWYPGQHGHEKLIGSCLAKRSLNFIQIPNDCLGCWFYMKLR